MLSLYTFDTILFLLYLQYHTYSTRSCHTSDPSYKLQYYSKNTGTTILRRHLYSTHTEEWITACKTLNISIKSAAALRVVSEWEDVDTDEEDSTSDHEVNPNADSEAWKPFTKEAFVDALIAWIVSDDQVLVISPSIYSIN